MRWVLWSPLCKWGGHDQYAWYIYSWEVSSPGLSDSETWAPSTVFAFLPWWRSLRVNSANLNWVLPVFQRSARRCQGYSNEPARHGPCPHRAITSSFAGNSDLRSGQYARAFWEVWGPFEDGHLPLSRLKPVLGHCCPGHLAQGWQEESFSNNAVGRLLDHKTALIVARKMSGRFCALGFFRQPGQSNCWTMTFSFCEQIASGSLDYGSSTGAPFLLGCQALDLQSWVVRRREGEKEGVSGPVLHRC